MGQLKGEDSWCMGVQTGKSDGGRIKRGKGRDERVTCVVSKDLRALSVL